MLSSEIPAYFYYKLSPFTVENYTI